MDELIELMCAAAWNVHGKPTWDKIPEVWKPFHRECMTAAFEAMKKHTLAMYALPENVPQFDGIPIICPNPGEHDHP